jgi:beta-galactosidase
MSGVTPAFGPVPTGVDVYPRESAHGQVFILVNFSKSPETVTLPSAMHDVLEGAEGSSTTSVTLPVYGVAVLSKPR